MYYTRPFKNRRHHKHRIKCGFTIAFPPISDRYRSDDGILDAVTHSDLIRFVAGAALPRSAALLAQQVYNYVEYRKFIGEFVLLNLIGR